MARKRVCLGAFAGAHGVKGLVKVKAFTEVPEAIAAYGPLSDEAGTRRFALTVTGRAKGLLLARVEGIGNRDQAEALTGTRLYVARDALPALEEEEFYHADLIGIAVEDLAGRPLGKVKAVHDFGAGPMIELEGGPGGSDLVLPFTRAVVPEVDPENGRLVVDPPAVLEEDRDDTSKA